MAEKKIHELQLIDKIYTVSGLKLNWTDILFGKYKLWDKYGHALLLFYYSPNHEGTIVDVANEFKEIPKNLSAKIMNFGRQVQLMEDNFIVNHNGTVVYWPVAFDGYYNSNNHLVLRLKPKIVEVIQKRIEEWSSLKDRFLKQFPLESLRSMTIEQYTNLNREDSFCYWLESRTNALGSIWGGSSFKFGIYQYEKLPKDGARANYDGKYCWLEKYNCSTCQEAFELIRDRIATIAEKATSGDLKAIDDIDMGDAVKWKIASIYSDNKVVNLYKIDYLQAAAKDFGYNGDMNCRSAMNKCVVSHYNPGRESFYDFYMRVGLHYFGKLEMERTYWLTGYTFNNNESQVERFVNDNIWEGRFIDALSNDQKLLPLAMSISEGDVVVLKGTGTKGSKHNQSFLRVKAVGVVTSNISITKTSDATICRCSVKYVSSTEKDFDGSGYGSFRKTIHKVEGNSKISDVIDYVNSLISPDTMLTEQPKQKKTESQYQKYIDLLRETYNLVLTGAPGTGKTYMAHSIAEEMGAETQFVQFHPSYDYTDFVEGLRPVEKGAGQVGFERKDGVFKEFCRNAVNNSGKDFVFIIDEINRGEASKIFGELFYAIDPGYRGQKKHLVQTQYQNLVPENDVFAKGFYVPENVYILATMNDIDRSVESMDFAMRRRFTWKEITPADTASMLNTLSCADKAKATMDRLNDAIAETDGLGAAYMIGPSYFLKLGKNGCDFEKLWNMNIQPLLKEYLRGFRKINEILDKFHAAYFDK